MRRPRLILASGSPRRARILGTLGLKFLVRPSDVDETIEEGESPRAAVRRLARRKVQEGSRRPEDTVIAADTVVAVRGRILGKPASEGEARAMLRSLSGRTHQVVTGVAVSRNGRIVSALDLTEVRFRRMSGREIAAYVRSGEPMDKAGAYHIDGAGAAFIEWIKGSPSNVAGLSVTTARRLLRKVGLSQGH